MGRGDAMTIYRFRPHDLRETTITFFVRDLVIVGLLLATICAVASIYHHVAPLLELLP